MILVTGAAGFIGSHLAEALAERGHDVVGVDCYTDFYDPALKRMNAGEAEAKGVRMVELDLAEGPLEEVLDGAEFIYHCAAQPGISAGTPFGFYVRNNLVATRRLAEAAIDVATLRCFVNVSTSSVYGRHATDSEEAPPKPTSYYGVTKLAAEQLVLSCARSGRLPACSLRLFSVYGPRERPEKLHPRLVECILAGKEFPLFEGSREHSRSYSYIDDIVRGFLAVLDHVEASAGEVFNIGSDIETTTGREIEIIEEIMGEKARIRRLPARPGDQIRTHADITKARRLLGYAPVTRPEEGLVTYVAWHRRVRGNDVMERQAR